MTTFPFISSIGESSSDFSSKTRKNGTPLRIQIKYFPEDYENKFPNHFFTHVCQSLSLSEKKVENKFDILVYAFVKKVKSFLGSDIHDGEQRNDVEAYNEFLELEKQCSALKPSPIHYSFQFIEYLGLFKLVVFKSLSVKNWEITSVQRSRLLLDLLWYKIPSNDFKGTQYENLVSWLHIKNSNTGEIVNFRFINLPSGIQQHEKRMEALKYFDMSIIEPEKNRKKTDIYIGNFNTQMFYYEKQDKNVLEQGASISTDTSLLPHLDDKKNYDLYLEYIKALTEGKQTSIKGIDEFEIIKESVPSLLDFTEISITKKKDLEPISDDDEEENDYTGTDKDGNILRVKLDGKLIAPSKTIRCLFKQNTKIDATSMKYNVEFAPRALPPFTQPHLTATFDIYPVVNVGAQASQDEILDTGNMAFAPLSIYFTAHDALRLAEKCGPERRGLLRVKLSNKHTLFERDLPQSSSLEFGHLMQYFGEQKMVDILTEEQGRFEIEVELICLNKEGLSSDKKVLKSEVIVSQLRGEIDLTVATEVEIAEKSSRKDDEGEEERNSQKEVVEKIITGKNRKFQRCVIVLRNYKEDVKIEAVALLVLESNNISSYCCGLKANNIEHEVD